MNQEIMFDEGSAGRYVGGEAAPLSHRTMQRMRLVGNGPAFVKAGRLVRYRKTDLDAWIEARVRRSTSEPTP